MFKTPWPGDPRVNIQNNHGMAKAYQVRQSRRDREEGGWLMSETLIDVTRYTYRVTWSVEDDQYVATCVELPSLSWLADTQEEALGGMRDLVAEVVRDLTDTGVPVPQPLSSRSYSGKFNLRVGEQLHRRLAMEAAAEHLSLNQYLVRRLSDAS